VAIAESVLFYRHLKPYFKYTIPALESEDLELEVWRKLPVMKSSSHPALLDSLRNIDHSKLSRKSQRLLQMSEEEREDFIATHKDSPVGRVGSIVAMCCLKRISSDANPPSHLVLATDSGHILILEPQGFNLVFQGRTCDDETAVPSLISVQGTFETDFCIVVATRNGGVYLLRKTQSEGQEIFKLGIPLTGVLLLPIDQTIIASTMDNRYLCYSKRGKLLHQVQLGDLPVCLLPLPMIHLGLTLVAIALRGGVVKFYLQRYLVDEFSLDETVDAMVYGRMGMEDHVLTLVTQSGKIVVKILRRVSRFEPKLGDMGSKRSGSDHKSIADASILDKPKKSSIFVEQAAREKQQAKCKCDV